LIDLAHERRRGAGKRVKRVKLEDGTHFTVGSTEISFSQGFRVTLASAQVETLLVLKLAFLISSTSSSGGSSVRQRDLRLPQGR
jgi:hypothetical protein